MNVIFKRTGLRRYAVAVKRPPHPDVEMNPAPGYDLSMPHDLMHMIVEAQLGLRHGIFGQLAAGGTAGTFNVPIPPDSASRTHGRVSRRVKGKGTKLLREGKTYKQVARELEAVRGCCSASTPEARGIQAADRQRG